MFGGLFISGTLIKQISRLGIEDLERVWDTVWDTVWERFWGHLRRANRATSGG